ncbi:MAG: hypothetical protein ABMA01_11395 [Chthoniobacteraceae bacterium]
MTAVSLCVRVTAKFVLLARKYFVPPAVWRPPELELSRVNPMPEGAFAGLMMMPTMPVVVAAAVEVSVSTDPAFQSKVRFAPEARFKAAVVVVARAVPSARLKLPPAFTCSVPVAGTLSPR